MQAIKIEKYSDDLSQLKVSKHFLPIPKKGHVLIRIHSVACNFFDILQSAGKYQTQPPLPFILGFEFAGTIVDPCTSSWKKGDRVFEGAYSEYISVSSSQILPVPDSISVYIELH